VYTRPHDVTLEEVLVSRLSGETKIVFTVRNVAQSDQLPLLRSIDQMGFA
jgi:hypothetical protein